MKKNYTNVAMTLILTFFVGSMAFAQIIADGTYKIFNAVHSEVITTETGDDYDAFMAAPDAVDNYQLWTFTHQGADIYKIVNVGSGNTLGINDGWCGQFGDVKGNFTNSDLNVEFKVSVADAADSYVFEIAFSTCNFGSVNNPIKTFDIQDGASGAQIQTYDVNTANPNQQFQILEPSALGVNEFNAASISSYYNKSSRKAYVNITNRNTISKVEVFDVNGRTIKTCHVTNESQATIDFNTNANGLYFVRLLVNNQLVVKKVLVY